MGELGDMWRVVWCHKFLIRVKIMWVISPLPAWQYLRRSGFYTDNRWVHSSFNILGSKSLSFFLVFITSHLTVLILSIWCEKCYQRWTLTPAINSEWKYLKAFSFRLIKQFILNVLYCSYFVSHFLTPQSHVSRHCPKSPQNLSKIGDDLELSKSGQML